MSLSLTLLAALSGFVPAEFCKDVPLEPQGDTKVVSIENADGVEGARLCAYIDATAEEAYDTMTDYPSLPQWMNKVEKTSVEWRSPVTADVSYEMDFVYKTAEYVLRRTHERPHHIRWHRAGGDFKVMDGEYHFVPAPDGKGIYFIMQQYLDAGVWVPGFVRDFIQGKATRRLVEDLRNEVVKRREAARVEAETEAALAAIPERSPGSEAAVTSTSDAVVSESARE